SAFYFTDHTTHFYALGGPDFVMGPDAPVAERNILGVIHKVGLEIGGKVIQARKRREVAARRREHFTVGIVGYTNAGKSTLFNTLTAGGAYADDRLFATLVTRTRDWDLGGGLGAMLSDTVGFVRDIPHHLVASFKATLEEATHADLLLIMLDVSDPGAELQYKTVNTVLDELFDELKKSHHEEDRFWEPPRRVLLLNKIDRLKDNAELLVWQRKASESIAISAIPDAQGRLSRGHDELVTLVRAAVQGEVRELDVTLPLSEAKTISVIEKQSEVLDRSYEGDHVTLRVRIGERQLAMLKSAGARIDAATTEGKSVEIASHRPQVGRARWNAAPEP
ncbi:MAG: GTPase, partial [Phycisphaerales bacterium]